MREEGMREEESTRDVGDWDDESGFSLLEMLISAAILLLFMGAAYLTSFHVQEVSMRTGLRIASQQGARLAVDNVARMIIATGSDPSGLAFDGVDSFAEATATTLRIRRDLPHDFNDNGTTWDVLDNNSDGDTEDDDENENGDGFLNDVGEDVTFTVDVANGTLTRTDNAASTVVTLADNVLANPNGVPFFAYSFDPASGHLDTITVTLTVAGERNDLLTDQAVAYTASTAIAPRLENTAAIIVVDSVPDTKKKKKKKK